MTQDNTKHPTIITVTPLPPHITGGIEEYAYSVVNGMRKEGLNVIVVTSRFNEDDATAYPEEAGYIYVPSRILFQRPILRNPLALIKVAQAIRRSDLIHIHMPYPLVEAFSAFIAKIYRKRILVTYHMDAKIDVESENTREPLIHSIIQKLYVLLSARWPLSYCDVICSNTRAYAESSPLLRRYLSKVRVVYQGIRRDLYGFLDRNAVENIRRKYLGQRYSYLVTFVGRLVPYKGLKYLIEAINIINKSITNNDKSILFVIGGSGPQKDYLINLVKEYNLTNVLFIGFVDDKDLFNLFAASDLVVSPSISELESVPITLLSALAVGTPVIGTSIGGTAETVPNDGVRGLIIPPKDSVALADAIWRMLNSKDQAKYKVTPLVRFWDDVAKDYIKILYAMLGLPLPSESLYNNTRMHNDRSEVINRTRKYDII